MIKLEMPAEQRGSWCWKRLAGLDRPWTILSPRTGSLTCHKEIEGEGTTFIATEETWHDEITWQFWFQVCPPCKKKSKSLKEMVLVYATLASLLEIYPVPPTQWIVNHVFILWIKCFQVTEFTPFTRYVGGFCLIVFFVCLFWGWGFFCLFLFLFFFCHACSQELNSRHSSDLSHYSDNARSLNHWAIRELQLLLLLFTLAV